MQSSNAPNKIQLPFAASGTKNTIPVPSQQGITPGAASFTDGFPPLTFTPLSAGGVPPAGADFNGILNSITALQQWKSAGGQFPFDATFAAAIGGYPKGATVLKADGTGLWISTTENNTANPDTGGAGWLAFSASSVQSAAYNTALDTGTVNAYAATLNPAPSALTNGMHVRVLSIKNANTGPATFNLNGLGAFQIFGMGGAALQGGEIRQSCQVDLVFQGNSQWILVSTFVGSFPVAAATASNQAVNLGQLEDGSLGPTFAQTIVAAATASNQAVNLGQFPLAASPNGYTKLANGLIIQWGSYSGASPASITFPVAFPNAVFNINICESAAGTWDATNLTLYGSSNETKTGFSLIAFTWGGSSYAQSLNSNPYWIAIGY